MDEFDQILIEISNIYLAIPTQGFGEEILKYSEIKEIFERRAKNKEFPASSYLAYLHFALTL